MPTPRSLLLGIDAGGTKTVACLALGPPADSFEIIGSARAGPGNPRAVGFELALGNIDAAVEAAYRNAAVQRAPAASACLAVAGAGREADRARVLNWARSLPLAKHVDVVHDAEPLLAAGTPEGWGIALIAGTGSLAYGRSLSGETARTGGWGYLIGDEGSGYALAIAGLRAATHAADGRGLATYLLDRFQQQLGVTQPLLLVEALYHSDMDRRRIADLATVVLDAAGEGDPVASRLVAAAARDLAGMVSVLSYRLRLHWDELPLALAGSLLLKSVLVRERLLAELGKMYGLKLRVSEVHDPVLGAVTLASRQL